MQPKDYSRSRDLVGFIFVFSRHTVSLIFYFFNFRCYLPDPWVCKAPKCMFVTLFVFPEPVIMQKMHATADQKNERLKMGIAEKKALWVKAPCSPLLSRKLP
jgi:hypothetical protein